jgi:asparagine synthase (glutamine-hydrolysing)
MCGIAGIVGQQTRVSREAILAMTDQLIHRGPDGSGVWIDPECNVGLGHRRLAVIDRSSGGAQPFLLNSRYACTYNGEIYNYVELRDRLVALGYRFRTESDTEVLLCSYSVFGVKVLEHLDGMFAFAIWDREKRELFCARDRFGEKPFFYSIRPNGSFAFASEMKSLFAIGVDSSICPGRVAHFFNDRYSLKSATDPASTFFDSVRQLPSGSFLLLRGSDVCGPTRYWDLDLADSVITMNIDEAAEQYRDLLRESVRKRLRSDIAVGASLSGGIDSSVIVCLANQLAVPTSAHGGFHTFSARSSDRSIDEGDYIKLVVERTNSISHFTWPQPDQMMDVLPKLYFHQEEPIASSGVYAQWCVAELAKQQSITVMLDGQGADEILTGYDHYYQAYWAELAASGSRRLKVEVEAGKKIRGLDFCSAAPSRQAGSFKRFWQKVQRSLNTNSAFFTEMFMDHASRKWLGSQSRPTSLREALYQDLVNGKLETLLRYSDRNSMAHSREVRLPYLDHRLVEFMFSLPSNFKIKNGWSKFLSRYSMRDILPRHIAWRRDKLGFATPDKSWTESRRFIDLGMECLKTLKIAGIARSSAQFNTKNAWQVIGTHFLLTWPKTISRRNYS